MDRRDRFRFRWPPAGAWFVVAWALYGAALVLPAVRVNIELDSPSGNEDFRGWQCLNVSTRSIRDCLESAVISGHHLGANTRYYGALGLCNLEFLASLLVVPLLPHRRRPFLACGVLSALATVVALTWFRHDPFEGATTSLAGAYVWAAAFLTISVAWFRAARTLGLRGASTG